MLVRLLVVVLAVVGPMPFRVCTCAASARPTTPADKPTSQPAHETKSCACGHRTSVSDKSPGDATSPAKGKADEAGSRSHPTQHERDCPVVSSRSVVVTTAPAPTPDSPVDGALRPSGSIETLQDTFARPGYFSAGPPVPSAVPLYLSLCTLRN